MAVGDDVTPTKTTEERELDELQEAVRNYLSERDNPVPDPLMVRLRRARLREVLGHQTKRKEETHEMRTRR
ncbi:MAG: hypothetical protein V3U11_10005 [Planctomycetota bacterium]